MEQLISKNWSCFLDTYLFTGREGRPKDIICRRIIAWTKNRTGWKTTPFPSVVHHMPFLPPANVVCEGYVFTDVCHYVHGGGGVHGCSELGWVGGMRGCSQGGCAWLLRGACVVAPGGTCMVALGGVRGCSRGGMHGCSWGVCMVAPRGACVVAPGGRCAWDMTRYGDTINERAVRILLECILVTKTDDI